MWCKLQTLFLVGGLNVETKTKCTLHSSRRLSLNFWHRSFTFNSNKSPTWCNSFSVYYPDVCLQLNMFRAFSRPSAGAQWLQWQPLVLLSYRGDSRAVFVVGPAVAWFRQMIAGQSPRNLAFIPGAFRGRFVVGPKWYCDRFFSEHC